MTTPPPGRVSPLQQARLDHRWSRTEAAARIRARCPGQHGTPCRVTACRLQEFEAGVLHPGPAHITVLTELYQRDAADLGLAVRPDLGN